MKKGIAPIFVLLIVLAISGSGLLLTQILNKKSSPNNINQEDKEISNKPEEITTLLPQEEDVLLNKDSKQDTNQVSTEPSNISKDNTAPLPQEEDVIRNFFSLINEGSIPGAISSMSKKMVGNDSTKQAWGVQFNAIKSISVKEIEPFNPESWGTNRHTYIVSLEAHLSPESAKAPIPFYGWEDNINIRWISIVKEGDLWKIDEIATGP